MSQALPLTDSQQAMWLLHTISGRGALFNVAECIEFKGKISATMLQQAFAHVWQSSNCLSCRFVHDNAFTPQLKPNAEVPTLDIIQLDAQPEDIPAFAEQFVTPAMARAFVLEQDALLKLTLVRAPEQDLLFLVGHHLLLDGYGFGLFTQALNRCYNALQKGKPLPKLPFGQQQDLLTLHNSEAYLARQQVARATLNNWLDGVPAPLSFSHQKEDVTEPNRRLSQAFTHTDWHTVMSAASVCQAGHAEVLLAAVSAALVARTAQYHITLGLIMMNRQHQHELSTPCVQSNVMPLPLELATDMTLSQCCRVINQGIKALKALQTYRVEDLKRTRQQQGKGTHIFGPTVNLLPFTSSPKYGGIASHSHILSAGTTDDIMLQWHLLQDQPARLDVDANVARYSDQQQQQVQAAIFRAAHYWSQHPTQTLGSVVTALNGVYDHVL
ncbi:MULTISPECIES: condensation domain-containing protein [unclassified Pseudoalteromonas]|uniref:condensation domain-containing protein n=1 Tax=unclassified Pseudoalteromonas TaxID=194690 RepID=UPI00209721E8|nr:condensation domain-containing protein [Pseudoalteromonas sp. XMcav2-N]MCO7190708.1 condensation domain-containing protein [Pseudoalteromonas sp. XMcav2-N]